MKKWSNKKLLAVGLAVIVLCVIVAGVMMVTGRSTKRLPTEQELTLCAPYSVNWQEATGQEGTDKQIILALCSYSGKQVIGSNEYDVYTSEELGGYLYRFAQMTHIGMLNDCLYIQYEDTEGNSITLTYSDAGLAEKAVYFPETDTLFYRQGELTEVWENFRSGARWGM